MTKSCIKYKEIGRVFQIDIAQTASVVKIRSMAPQMKRYKNAYVQYFLKRSFFGSFTFRSSQKNSSSVALLSFPLLADCLKFLLLLKLLLLLFTTIRQAIEKNTLR